jgi:hypothetical protein
MLKTHYCSVSCFLQGTMFLRNFLRDFLWCILHNFGFKWVSYINTQMSVPYLLFAHHALKSSHMTVHWSESAWDLWLIHHLNTLTTEGFKVLGLWWTRDGIYHNQKTAVYKNGSCDSHKSFWVNIGYEFTVDCN